MSEIIDENKLVKIANILQLMVGKNTNYQSYDEISPAIETDLRTCVAMIARMNEDELFFEPTKTEKTLESFNLKISNVIESLDCIDPQIIKKISLIIDANTPLTPAWKVHQIDFTSLSDTFRTELRKWCEASSDLIDLIDEVPKSISRKNWKPRYIARYVAIFYRSTLKTLPMNSEGNPKKKYVKAVNQICKILNFDFPAAKYACAEVLNLYAEGKDLEPPLI